MSNLEEDKKAILDNSFLDSVNDFIKYTGTLWHKNPCLVMAHLSTSQTGIADSAWTTIVFNTEIADLNGAFNNTTGTFTAPCNGYYQVDFVARCTATGIDNSYARMFVNGTTSYLGTRISNGAILVDSPFCYGLVYLNKGDTMVAQVFVNCSSGTVTAYSAGDYNYTTLSIRLVSK